MNQLHQDRCQPIGDFDLLFTNSIVYKIKRHSRGVKSGKGQRRLLHLARFEKVCANIKAIPCFNYCYAWLVFQQQVLHLRRSCDFVALLPFQPQPLRNKSSWGPVQTLYIRRLHKTWHCSIQARLFDYFQPSLHVSLFLGVVPAASMFSLSNLH
eukprot:SAG31_NODE_7973_length_1551_cov_1.342975_3_plen_154_part_00